MANSISVGSYSTMNSAADQFKSAAESYDSIGKELLRAATTMGKAWDGADNQAYANKIQGISKELDAMSKKLAHGGEALRQQTKNYMDRQDANVAGAAKLGG